MMKLSLFLRARSAAASDKSLSNAKSALGARSFSFQTENRSSNFMNNYTVFKGKAALSAAPILPASNESQTGSKYDKKGCIMLTFWPAIGERKYDWQKRQVFALSPTELGSLISLEPGKNCEFFHDPSMKSSNAGQVRKSLSVTPLSEDSGYFFTLTVVNNILKTNERFSVPVSKAEYTVMRTAFTYVLPHILGWNPVSKQVPTSSGPYPGRQQVPTSSGSYPVRQQVPISSGPYPVRQQAIPPTPDLEWDK